MVVFPQDSASSDPHFDPKVLTADNVDDQNHRTQYFYIVLCIQDNVKETCVICLVK